MPTARDRSAASRKRNATGRDFESDIDFTARQWEFQRIGKIWPHSPPFQHIGKEQDGRPRWTPKAGGGPVDRTGHVTVMLSSRPSATLPGKIEPVFRPHAISENPGTTDLPIVIPVAFDCKVHKAGHLAYEHDAGSRHQLEQLRDAARAGVFAFLLIHAPAFERVFALPIERHYSDLQAGRSVPLATRANALGGRSMLAASMPKRLGSIGCDFIALLPWCTPSTWRIPDWWRIWRDNSQPPRYD